MKAQEPIDNYKADGENLRDKVKSPYMKKRERSDSMEMDIERNARDENDCGNIPVLSGTKETTTMKKDLESKVVKSTNENDPAFSVELLGMYYSRLFPYSFLHSWLSYSSKEVFSHREFSFTIMGEKKEEIYIRYQSYSTIDEFKSSIIKTRPHKIDIGAVFSHRPKDKNAFPNDFDTMQRELVFDIDLTDYDNIRNCGCREAQICRKCWVFMHMAIRTINRGLELDFGFKHIAWFYSGRRGVHCWVSDKTARELTNEARNAIVSYLEIEFRNKSVEITTPLHPSLLKSYEILLPDFVKYILPANGHGLLSSSESWTDLLSTLPASASTIKTKLTEKFNTDDDVTSPEEKWTDILKHISVFLKTQRPGQKSSKYMSSNDRSQLENWKYETVLTYTYPRIDVNVSKMQNHLLKSPFCVHPKTGRVCVPINITKLDEFDPFCVPTLGQLRRELDDFCEKKKELAPKKQVGEEWRKTSLRESFEFFEKEILGPMKKDWRKANKEAMEEDAAMKGEF